MQRTTSGSSNNSTTLPLPTTPPSSYLSSSSQNQPFALPSSTSSSTSTSQSIVDELVKSHTHTPSPRLEVGLSGGTASPLDLHAHSHSFQGPITPLNAKSIRPQQTPGSTLPTPPDSLTRMQQQQQPISSPLDARSAAAPTSATIGVPGAPVPRGLSLSPMSINEGSAPLAYAPRKRELSKSVQIYEDTSLMSDESHITDSLSSFGVSSVGVGVGDAGAISPLTGRVRSRTLPLDAPDMSMSMSIRITGDLGRDHSSSETSSLLSPVSADSAPSSAGSATSRSPSLQTSFQLEQTHGGDDYPHLRSQSPSPRNASFGNGLLVDNNESAAERLAKPILDASSPYSNPLMTTNVYINGLPPHFPEEELLELVQDFGGVVSVKTFTRNNDPPSGYGFVLFDSLECAEACVKELRKFRNLHPSFAKRTHRIPGTALEAPIFTPNYPAYPVPAGFTNPYMDSHESFNSKMERLADQGSSNLYVEGLPENTDAHLLEALVAPHRVKSSRIFPSKLSNPPRMIAFVRLESREAAVECIDALNGRQVRGYNGAEGDKIVVKFADSAHQRDLRKMERVAREQRDRMRLEAQASRGHSGLSSPQFGGIGLQSPISSLQSYLPSAPSPISPSYGQALGTPQLSGPATTAELERLIEILRLSQQQAQVQVQQQPPQPATASSVTNTLAAALLQAQLQNQAQAQATTSNLYDFHHGIPASINRSHQHQHQHQVQSLAPTSSVSSMGTQLYNSLPHSHSHSLSQHYHHQQQQHPSHHMLSGSFGGTFEQSAPSYAPLQEATSRSAAQVGGNANSLPEFGGRQTLRSTSQASITLAPNGASSGKLAAISAASANANEVNGARVSRSAHATRPAGSSITISGGTGSASTPSAGTTASSSSSSTVSGTTAATTTNGSTKASIPRYVPPPAREHAHSLSHSHI